MMATGLPALRSPSPELPSLLSVGTASTPSVTTGGPPEPHFIVMCNWLPLHCCTHHCFCTSEVYLPRTCKAPTLRSWVHQQKSALVATLAWQRALLAGLLLALRRALGLGACHFRYSEPDVALPLFYCCSGHAWTSVRYTQWLCLPQNCDPLLAKLSYAQACFTMRPCVNDVGGMSSRHNLHAM